MFEMITAALAVASIQAASAPALEHSDYPSQRRRVMALVAEGDCAGAHGAVFVMADRAMLELVESICPMGTSDVLRWDAWNHDEFAGMFTDAQIATARRIAGGEDVPAASNPDDFDRSHPDNQ